MPPTADANGAPANATGKYSASGHAATTLSSIDKTSFRQESDRMEALLEAYKLVSRLETPWETCLRLGMAQVRTRPSWREEDQS